MISPFFYNNMLLIGDGLLQGGFIMRPILISVKPVLGRCPSQMPFQYHSFNYAGKMATSVDFFTIAG